MFSHLPPYSTLVTYVIISDECDCCVLRGTFPIEESSRFMFATFDFNDNIALLLYLHISSWSPVAEFGQRDSTCRRSELLNRTVTMLLGVCDASPNLSMRNLYMKWSMGRSKGLDVANIYFRIAIIFSGWIASLSCLKSVGWNFHTLNLKGLHWLCTAPHTIFLKFVLKCFF